MASHRDLARALFLRDIGALRRVRVVQPVADSHMFGLFTLLGATVRLDMHYDTAYVEGDALPTIIPLGWSLEATL